MVNEWLALERVGEWAGLEHEQLREYLDLAQEIQEGALDRSEGLDLEREYFNFLNRQVFSDDRLLEFLQEANVDQETYQLFENGSVPVEKTFRSYKVVDYGLDEVVDFVMLLRLFDQYQDLTGTDLVKPLEKLHTLAYLVNYRLSEEPDHQSSMESLGYGMLERTGYRYTFRREGDHLWSKSLQRDIDRLFAWNLVDREVVEDPRTSWDVHYSVSLGEASEIFLNRYQSKLDQLDSVLLREWDKKQEGVLRDFANTSKTGLSDHLETIDRFAQCTDSRIVLNGRPKRFESETELPITIHA